MNQTVNVLAADKHVITVENNGKGYKLFQIIFQQDGSIFVDFPYYQNSEGIACEMVLDASLKYPANISLTKSGKITSHLVKFSHHGDGRAHFSQTGKIYTQIKKQAVPLSEVEGHLFTVMLQGFTDFEVVVQDKDKNHFNSKRNVLSVILNGEHEDSLKFVGRWYPWNYMKDKVSSVNPDNIIGPKMLLEVEKGRVVKGFLLGPPIKDPNNYYILYLSCELVPKIYKDGPSGITFIGGFDRRSVATNLSKSTSMLVLSYPITNAKALAAKIGSIDYNSSPD